MSKISVALLQMSSCGTDQEANPAKGDVSRCRGAFVRVDAGGVAYDRTKRKLVRAAKIGPLYNALL
jgi:hypothetical protein